MAPTLPPLTGKYAEGLKLIDEAHAQDPNTTKGENGSGTMPYELHYAQEMTRWLAELCPDASPVLQLACRAQHFRRWEIARSSYPMTRAGYLAWREALKVQAAAQAQALLAPLVGDDDAARVAALLRKEGVRAGGAVDPEVQALEDAACLVFLDDQFDDFGAKGTVDEAKVVSILRKTWAKMSPRGHELALAMQYSDMAKDLIGKALAPAQ